jgi:hypothetical protein
VIILVRLAIVEPWGSMRITNDTYANVHIIPTSSIPPSHNQTADHPLPTATATTKMRTVQLLTDKQLRCGALSSTEHQQSSNEELFHAAYPKMSVLAGSQRAETAHVLFNDFEPKKHGSVSRVLRERFHECRPELVTSMARKT